MPKIQRQATVYALLYCLQLLRRFWRRCRRSSPAGYIAFWRIIESLNGV